ncbi:MAG: hypothetical protein ACRC33_21625 [Gemmataceae bacterium]
MGEIVEGRVAAFEESGDEGPEEASGGDLALTLDEVGLPGEVIGGVVGEGVEDGGQDRYIDHRRLRAGAEVLDKLQLVEGSLLSLTHLG